LQAACDESAGPALQGVIYGRKFGTALTMDVFAPKKGANGAGVIVVVSGGWYSGHDAALVNGHVPNVPRWFDKHLTEG
jgi:hypothetical protein